MKFKLSLYIFLLATGAIITPQATIHSAIPVSMNKIVYQPIASYQKMISDMVYNLMLAFLYKQTTAIKKDAVVHRNEDTADIKIVIPEKPTLSRKESLEQMKEITSKIFNSHDHEFLQKHLTALTSLCKYLDEQEDKEIIAAITFLSDNQHKAGPLDLIFWVQANKKYKFETSIPMQEEMKTKNAAEKISVLRKKMTIQNDHLKKEQNSAEETILVV